MKGFVGIDASAAVRVVELVDAYSAWVCCSAKDGR